jgi:valacyclovir hydrolase
MQYEEGNMAWFEHGTSRIYYEESGSGSPVLLLPGFAGSIAEFSALREILAAEYRVIAADLPGSGRSEPQPRDYTATQTATYYEDDAHSFAALLEQLGTGPTRLVGFSDGGEVALLMAALVHDVARSVVTWGSAGAVAKEDLPMVGVMSNMVDAPIPPLQPFRDYLVATYGEANARAMTQSFAGAMGGIIERGEDISISKVGRITCPVLLNVGEHDMIARPELVSQLAKLISASESVVVEGAGHPVHADKPDWLVQTLTDWLKKH